MKSSFSTTSKSAAPAVSAAEEANGRRPAARRAVWFLFFFSGATGLIYEVLWTRDLGLILGNTVESLTAVLTAFMSGLAVGSVIAGRLAKRVRRPLLVYGLLELFVGIYCALLPLLFKAAVPFYRSLYDEGAGGTLPAVRFSLSLLLLLAPTVCMGATLPLLSQFMVRSAASLGKTAGGLYAVNTFGAVTGAVAAGFVLLPWLGRSTSNYTAVVCNLLLGTAAVVLGRKAVSAAGTSEAASEKQPAREKKKHGGGGAEKAGVVPQKNRGKLLPAWRGPAVSPTAFHTAATAFAVTGFAAMVTQIAWTRTLTLALGGSTYAFSLIVAVFIFGLGLGSALGARFSSRLADPVAVLGGVLLGIGICTAVVAAFLGWAPLLFFFLSAWGAAHGSFYLLLTFQVLGVALLLSPATILMGATMPLTLRTAADYSKGAGRTVGSLYALNTAGAILGSLLGGLILIPYLHLQASLEFASLLYVLPGLTLVVLSPAIRSKEGAFRAATATAGALLLLCLAAPWDSRVLNCGAYLMRDAARVRAAREFRFGDALPLLPPKENVIYHREGAAATVAVERTEDNLALIVGGKPDASSRSDMATQIGLALIPAFMHRGPVEDALVIGMGSGVTAGAILSLKTVRRLDIVETAPEVVPAAACFAPYNHLKFTPLPPGGDVRRMLAEPRARLLLNDGRNHLLLTKRRYDVITAEPSNPWIAGIGTLFTREAFTLAANRLKPGGVFCQWLQSYRLNRDDFLSVVRTFTEVFPHAILWEVDPGADFLLLGSKEPPRTSLAELHRAAADEAVGKFMRAVGFDRPEDLMAGYVADEARLRKISRNAELHTDDNMRLEFNAPRSLYNWTDKVRTADWRTDPAEIITDAETAPAFRRRLATAVEAHLLLEEGTLDPDRRARLFFEAFRLCPHLFRSREAARKAFKRLAEDLYADRPLQDAVWVPSSGKPTGGAAGTPALRFIWLTQTAVLLNALEPSPLDEPYEALEREILLAEASTRVALDAGDHDQARGYLHRLERLLKRWEQKPPTTPWGKKVLRRHQQRREKLRAALDAGN